MENIQKNREQGGVGLAQRPQLLAGTPTLTEGSLPPVEGFFTMRPAPDARSGGEVLSDLRARLKGERSVIAQGYGLEDGPLPVRSLAYAIPTFRLLRDLPETTKGEIYIATEGVLRANPTLDKDAVYRNEKELTALLSAYLEVVHPTLEGRVRILGDRVLPEHSETERFILELTEELAGHALKDESLSSFIRKRGGENALRYVAEHAVYMRDAIQPRPFKHLLVDGMEQDVDTVVMVGGPAEKIFYRARQLLVGARNIQNAVRTEQLITPIGEKRPPYHFETGEITFDDLREESSALTLLQRVAGAVTTDYGRSQSVVRDLIALLADAGSFTLLPDKGMVKATLNGTLEAPYVAALERGLSNLRKVAEGVFS